MATSCLVASALLLGLNGHQQFNPTRQHPVNSNQAAAWSSVARSIAVLPDINGQPFGVAFQVDDSGLFVAHVSALVYEPLKAKVISGNQYVFARVAFDRETQLVLMQAQNWSEKDAQPINFAPSAKPGEVMVATANGPLAGQLTSATKAGVIQPSQRFLPLVEVQMEQKDFPVGGALVVDTNGQAIGILGAVLSPIINREARNAIAGNTTQAKAQFGPMGLTVGYALGPKVLTRVIRGFQSKAHKVEHPSIGVFFRVETLTNRVIIERVTQASAAAKAGIFPGDVVLAMDGTPVRDPEQLAVMLFESDPGDEIVLKIDRLGEIREIRVKVGIQEPSQFTR